jgi:hypothetical protein
LNALPRSPPELAIKLECPPSSALLLLLWVAKRSRQSGVLDASRQYVGGVLVLVVALVLLLRGDLGLCVGLGLFGLYLLAEVLPWPLNLLASYLDRRNAVWREHAQGDANSAGWRPASGKMTEQEAYQIRGIAPGASLDEISRAHRSPMKKLHPDQGGTTHLAARINEAKDVLLRRHR